MTILDMPKFHRQRFLLLVLKLAGGALGRTDLQKMTFLTTKGAGLDYYDFVPYKFGCYSFQIASDLNTLQSQGWIVQEDNGVRLMVERLPQTGLSKDVTQLTRYSVSRLKELRGKELVRHVYKKYPYFAINSEIAYRVSSKEELVIIENERKKLEKNSLQLFTIGYEGASFEDYANKLIKNNVVLLCDVRKNPLSRKFGFSKNTLSVSLPKLGIKYIHIPELGIVSDKRKNLNDSQDYIALFDDYKKSLPAREEALSKLGQLLEEHNRIALTCFEKEHKSCHRHCISDHMELDLGIKAMHL